ncbi:hypothetical protein B484DRAFT_397966 [Ochromonadaceae sp. CCMP2298]|nr:hypothetical protein B484DRAFT_397966 [Ochromonadaceae sp. CCMP2298]
MESCAAGVAVLIEATGEPSKALAYGTAGFRDKFDLPLDHVFVRMGVLAAIRSMFVSSAVGAVVTASHNAEADNGLKLVDFDGGMLSQDWEPHAVRLANCPNADFVQECSKLMQAQGLTMGGGAGLGAGAGAAGLVLMGRDTRPHSAHFSQLLRQSVELTGGACYDLGEVTTPVVHYAVWRMRQGASAAAQTHTQPHTPATFNAAACVTSYYAAMAEGYTQLVRTAPTTPTTTSPTVFTSTPTPTPCASNTHVVLDASCGVGSITAQGFLAHYAHLQTLSPLPPIFLDIRNAAFSGPVNDLCGAEHAQKLQEPPKGVCPIRDAGKLMCSFDGDGDRIVFHAYVDAPSDPGFVRTTWLLLDGDKIATLMAVLLQQELEAAGLLDKYTFAVVQTAYANGASTSYIRTLGVPIHLTKTGVKYLHHRAADFDVGVYFEANGHGTVLFSPAIVAAVQSHCAGQATGADAGEAGAVGVGGCRNVAFARLGAIITLINPATGDALSDLLFCMGALQVLGLDLHSWHALYADLPSRQVKVVVPDKGAFHCSEDETSLIRPKGMQKALKAAMGTVPQGRCFVRPSGTEDVVRIYAEAGTQAGADRLAQMAEEIIHNKLGWKVLFRKTIASFKLSSRVPTIPGLIDEPWERAMSYTVLVSFSTVWLYNVERVWIAEKKAEEEKKQLMELQKQLEEERQILELRQLQAAQGQVSKTIDNSLDWMYEGPMSQAQQAVQAAQSSEEFLLGKIYQGAKPVAIPEGPTVSIKWMQKVTGKNDSFSRLHEDPFVLIKQEENRRRERLVNNPVKMSKIQQQVTSEVMEQESKREEKEQENRARKAEKREKKKAKREKKKEKKDRRNRSRGGDRRGGSRWGEVSNVDVTVTSAPSSSVPSVGREDRGRGDGDREIVRETDRDGGRDRDGYWDRDRDGDRNRDGGRGGNRDSGRDRSRDRSRDRDRDRNRGRGGGRDRYRDSDRDRSRDRDGDRNRGRDRSRDRDGDRNRDGGRDGDIETQLGRKRGVESGEETESGVGAGAESGAKTEAEAGAGAVGACAGERKRSRFSEAEAPDSSKTEEPKRYGLLRKDGGAYVGGAGTGGTAVGAGPSPALLAARAEQERQAEEQRRSRLQRNDHSVRALSQGEREARISAMQSDAQANDAQRVARQAGSSGGVGGSGDGGGGVSGVDKGTDGNTGNAVFLADMRKEVYADVDMKARIDQNRHYRQSSADIESSNAFMKK